MMRAQTSFLLVFSVFLLLSFSTLLWCKELSMASSVELVEKPFWRVKPKLLNKILENRDIIVSVSTKVKKSDLYMLQMHGGGMVKNESSLVFAEVQKYENLKKISPRIVEVKVTPDKSEIFIHCEAFNYHARMWMSVSPSPNIAQNKDRRLNFKVLRGNFVGMAGAFTFENYKPGITLMGFNATYDYKDLPMPRFFVEFGLEVVLQKVARDMRAFLEKASGL